MKKLFLLAAIATLLTANSCSTTKATAWVKSHCKENHVINADGLEVAVFLTCDSLHSTAEINEICKDANLCYNPAKASVTAEFQCGGKESSYTQKAVAIFKAIKKAIFK